MGSLTPLQLDILKCTAAYTRAKAWPPSFAALSVMLSRYGHNVLDPQPVEVAIGRLIHFGLLERNPAHASQCGLTLAGWTELGLMSPIQTEMALRMEFIDDGLGKVSEGLIHQHFHCLKNLPEVEV